MNRDSVLGNLRPSIRALVDSAEADTGLPISFQISHLREVLASYHFDCDTHQPIVSLSPFATEVDVAHEVMHMVLQLVEGYPMFAWRQDVPHLREIAAAIGVIHSYVQDEEVHRRLLALGLQGDGEVIRPQFFNDLCTTVARALKAGKPRAADGMSHLDPIGHGHLRRSAFLVQAELIRKRMDLSPEHASRLEDLICCIRKYRRPEAMIADQVLALFDAHDVATVHGQAAILESWADLEGLGQHVGVTFYRSSGKGYELPLPPSTTGMAAVGSEIRQPVIGNPRS